MLVGEASDRQRRSPPIGFRIPDPGSRPPWIPAARGFLKPGFTLVESLVALAVLMTLLLLALPLVIESLRLLNETGRRMVTPDQQHARARLRNDLEAASAVPPGSGDFWLPAPLELRRGATVVVWELAPNGDLTRREWRPGEEGRQRLLAIGIAALRWRHVDGVMQVELTGRGAPRAAVRTLSGARPSPPAGDPLQVERISVAPRARSRSAGW